MGGTRMPDWVAFEKLVTALRKKYRRRACGENNGHAEPARQPPWRIAQAGLPDEFRVVVDSVRQSVSR